MGMLSSQTRKWGPDSDKEEEEDEDDDEVLIVEVDKSLSRAPFAPLSKDDWPISPPRSRPLPLKPSQSQSTSTFSGSVSSRPTLTSGSSSSSSSQQSRFNSSSSSSASNHASSSSSFYKNKQSTSSTIKSHSTPYTSTTSSTKLAPLFRQPNNNSNSNSDFDFLNSKKRSLPWDNIPTDNARASTSSSKPIIFESQVTTDFGGGSGGRAADPAKEVVVLSSEQQRVLNMVVNESKSVFFTGSAGTGKSVLLREIISALKKKFSGRNDAVAVTASTGMAACNIGGTTIHSFSGIGLGQEGVEVLIAKVKRNKVASGKWARTQVLVVDEISMVDGILFDKLSAIGTAIRKNPKAFGGLQLVVTGDFFQLPPVAKGSASATFAFEAKAWKQAMKDTVNLTQVFRQKSTEFIDMLNEMRFGKLSMTSIEKFRKLSRVPDYDDGVDPTELFPRREDVDRSNQARLNALPGESTIYEADDVTPEGPEKAKTYLDNFMAPSKLVLKIGAQVMLIKNLDHLLVNGTIGKVIGYGAVDLDDDDEDDRGREWEEDERGGYENFEERQKKKIKLAKEIGAGNVELAPIVEWITPEGVFQRPMKREEFKAEDSSTKKVLAMRKQYPLILAWAMSIHKSQGQTLPRVKVDLRKVFEKGQSYVALSRATCLDGLQVLGFDPKKVEAHPKVIQWSKTLQVVG